MGVTGFSSALISSARRRFRRPGALEHQLPWIHADRPLACTEAVRPGAGSPAAPGGLARKALQLASVDPRRVEVVADGSVIVHNERIR
jgi:hypothetical protein